MGRGSLKEKNLRRDSILGLLKSGSAWTVASLGQELSVSHRTISRDLDELRESGIPIETERGRGGGVRLDGRWGLDKLRLSHSEAISLLVSLAVTESLSPSMIATHSTALRQKISLAFPEQQRGQINRLRSRILFGEPASARVLNTYKKPNSKRLQQLTAAFFESRKIEIQYQSEKLEKTRRTVEPHYLLLNWPVWYLLGWDEFRDAVRMFRTDRIMSVVELNESNKNRAKSVFIDSYEAYFKSV